MSDQTQSLGDSVQHAGFDFATCQLTLNTTEIILADGRNDNVLLVATQDLNEPAGFARFNSLGAGPISISGMVPNNAHFPDHSIALFCRNDMGINLTFLNASAFSRPECRFIIGADLTVVPGTMVMFMYLPDLQLWGLMFHNP